MLETALALSAVAGFFGCRWRHDEVRADGNGTAGRARAGRLLRILFLPAICGLAISDWRPTIARHASSGWLVQRARDEGSNFRYAAVDELVRRLNAETCDAAEQGEIVRGLWTTHAWPDDTFTVGTPFTFNLSIVPPSLPPLPDETLRFGRSLGTIEWRVVAASFDGVPIGGAATVQSMEAMPTARGGGQDLPLPPQAGRRGGGTFRCEVAFAYRAPGAAGVGPTWSESFSRPIVAADAR